MNTTRIFGLNWMDFQARQYDPQLGRFLGVDPLANIGEQDKYSPYATVGNAPESMIDPNGEYAYVELDVMPDISQRYSGQIISSAVLMARSRSRI